MSVTSSWGIYSRSPTLIRHCSFIDTSPDALATQYAYEKDGSYYHQIIENSLFYTANGSEPLEYNYSSYGVEIRNSIFTNQYFAGRHTVFSIDPIVTRQGYLKQSSPAIGLADVDLALSRDLLGQYRDEAPDIGAIEFIDTDGDGLPDWLELAVDLLVSDDEDGDLLSNLEEYEFSTSLWLTDEDDDGLDDYGEYLASTDTFSSDTDIDGMSDGDEITYGFDPLDWRDALDDADGDNIPNVYELARGTEPLVAESEASLNLITDYYVNSATGSISSSDNIYSTIFDAYSELSSDSNNEDDYYVIRLAAGEYEAAFNFYIEDRRVLILGESLTESETIIKVGGGQSNTSLFFSYDDIVLSNLVFEQSDTIDKTAIRAVTTGADALNQFKIHHCIFRGFDSDAFYHLLWLRGGHNYIDNCTFYGNKSSLNQSTVDAGGIYTHVEVNNSILWNPGWSSSEFTNATNVTYNNSLIGGDDPLLTIDGYLKHNSPAIDAVLDTNFESKDLHGEVVTGSARDIGADEFVDVDGDLVADSWEMRHYGTLDNDASYDLDEGLGDTATSLEEYEYALDPHDRDTDDDNFAGGDYSLDGQEIHRLLGATDPHNPDSDGDRMIDGFEIKYELKPNDHLDVILDKDGDQIPNIHEWMRGSSPNDFNDVPVTDYFVNPDQATNSNNDNIYATLGEVIIALNELKENDGDYAYKIIKIQPGLYKEQIEIEDIPGLVLIADKDTNVGYPEFRINDASENVFTIRESRDLVMDGIAISRDNVPGYEGTGGEGVYLYDDTRDAYPAYRFVNCLFKEHYKGDGAIYLFASSSTEKGIFYIDHCTFVNNLSHGSTSSKSVRNYNFDLLIRNSLLWNLGATGNELFSSGGNITYTNSYIYGDSVNSLAGDPLVNQQYGFLRPGSPAIDAGTSLDGVDVSFDYTGETRDATPDVGVDEFVDLDGDGMADSWEVIHDFDVTPTDSDGNGVSDGADSNNNGILDGEEDPDGDGLTNLQENGFDEDPNIYNIVESVTPDSRWVDVLDSDNRSMSITVKLHRTDDQVTVHFRKFSFNTTEFDSVNYPGVEDFYDYEVSDTSLASIALGPLSGDLEKTITWDGLAGVDYNSADVILPVIEMVDSNGTSHFHEPITSYYVPEVSISQFPISGGGIQGNFRTTVWRNYPHVGTLGSDSMVEPVLIHHKLFPNLVNQRPIFGATSTGNWIPFEEDGSPWAETGNAWMGTVGKGIEGDETSNNAELKFFSVRRLPSSSVVCLNQHANVESYSVESYESSAAHGEVSHAVFTLDRAADVTLTMLSPGGEEMPLYYRDTNGNYVNAVNMNCPAGANDIEFYAMDYSNPSSPKVLDNVFSDQSIEGHGHFKLREINSNPIGTREYRRYWRVKFTITDQRTGNVRTKWALVKVLK